MSNERVCPYAPLMATIPLLQKRDDIVLLNIHANRERTRATFGCRSMNEHVLVLNATPRPFGRSMSYPVRLPVRVPFRTERMG